MKSDGPTGVRVPTLEGNSTSSMVLFGSKVCDQSAVLLECCKYIHDADLKIDFYIMYIVMFVMLHRCHGWKQKPFLCGLLVLEQFADGKSICYKSRPTHRSTGEPDCGVKRIV